MGATGEVWLRSSVVSGCSELTTVIPSLSIISTSVIMCTALIVVSIEGVVVVGLTLCLDLVWGIPVP